MLGLAAGADDDDDDGGGGAALSSSWRDRRSTDGGGASTCAGALAGCAALVCNERDADVTVTVLGVRKFFPRTTSLSPTYTQHSNVKSLRDTTVLNIYTVKL